MRHITQTANPPSRTGSPRPALLDRLPPPSFFAVSALFHYLGPSLAVLLFAQVDVLGVAWLRIATAAAVFALWRRPWRLARQLDGGGRLVLVQLGAVLAAMNSFFYLAVDRLPLATVGAVEFLATVLLAAVGTRTRRNAVALVLTTLGIATITNVRLAGEPAGFLFAFANCALFMLYVVLGHRIANSGGGGRMRGIDRLGASMLVAAVVVTPVGLGGALRTLSDPRLLLAGAAVGICSSVIPYVTDQLAMARLPRASFALMLALLPMFATVIGAVVLHQVPTVQDLLGIGLVIAGVALHQVPAHEEYSPSAPSLGAAGPTGRRWRGLRAVGLVRPEGLADRSGDDELRRSGLAGVDPAGGRRRADRSAGGRGRRDLLRHR